MFTGIIETTGKIDTLDRSENGARLRVGLVDSGAAETEIATQMRPGDSIAVNGCCLTVTDFSATNFSTDLSLETLRRTAFGEMKPGDLVNLERPLAAQARLGGHFVQGHVDGIGRVIGLSPEGENWWLSVGVPQDLRRYVAPKGSIAVDGISLTVAAWHEGIADFAIIPFTYAHTNLRMLAPNASVNLECDILAKYVESLLESRRGTPEDHATSRLTRARLIEEGF
jgi:riboflavin synthase